ncbi:MAG: carboxymuconolactone decarboxylase family protein [Alphaproteobacteria bacterium]
MWITHLSFEEAGDRLKKLYQALRGPDGAIDNILLAHSLRPHTMQGHMALYKNVLHHSANSVPKWFLETIGVLVSTKNQCTYCVEHHFAGLKRILGDDARANAIRAALEADDFSKVFTPREAAALAYARALTQAPQKLKRGQFEALRTAGWQDGEILEINQVTAYFAYANRTVIGLGVEIEGEELGLAPSNADDPNDWSHR